MRGGVFGMVVLFACYSVVKCELPEYIQVCQHDHPNISACIINSIEHLRPHLKVGIKEINVPSLEPLELEPLSVNTEGSTSRISYNITDFRVWGASNFKIRNLTTKARKNGYTFDVEVAIEKLHVEAQCEINSKILFLSLYGKGPLMINISDYQFFCPMKGHKESINGVNRMVFDRFPLTISIGKANIYLANLFDGNQVLTNATNDVLNDNAAIFLDEIRPGVQNGLSNLFTDIANKVTSSFTYEELFP